MFKGAVMTPQDTPSVHVFIYNRGGDTRFDERVYGKQPTNCAVQKRKIGLTLLVTEYFRSVAEPIGT